MSYKLDLEWRKEGEVVKAYYDGRPVVWSPQPGSQRAFLACPVFEVLYEGPRGTGKTDTLIIDFVQHVGQGFGPEWRGVLFRKTYKQLDDVVQKTKKLISGAFPSATFREDTMTWTWQTGERLTLSYMARPDDYFVYHGSSFPWIGWEELTTWPDDKCYKAMFSCCRSSRSGMPRKIRATTNPYGCVPFGEVLTATGWRQIQDVRCGDMVVSCAPEGEMSLTPVAETHEYDHVGDLVERDGRGIFMSFTPCHRLPEQTKNGFSLRAFHDLPGWAIITRTGKTWTGRNPERFYLPTKETRRSRLKQPKSLSWQDYATLMGWFLSEGSVNERQKTFSIAQMKPQNRLIIKTFLDRSGFKGSWSSNQVMVSSSAWYEYLKQFGKCRDKFVPRDLLESSPETLHTLLTTLMAGDGHWYNFGRSGRYYTISKALANDVTEIGVKLGYTTRLISRQRKNRDGLSYEVSLSHPRPAQLHTGNRIYKVPAVRQWINVKRVAFGGKVYCLTVPKNETFFIRQNGCVWLSGNSGHNWLRQRFGLPALPGRIATDVRTEDGLDRVAIHSTLEENKVLLAADPGYAQKVSASARNKSELAAWLNGSWDIVSGGMLDDVWSPKHHVLPNFPLQTVPRGWKIDRSYDHGQARPFSVGWWAESNGEPMKWQGREIGTVRGDLIRINEWYGWSGSPNEGLRMPAAEVARGILAREAACGLKGRVLPGPADSSIFDDFDPGHSVAGEMRRIGVDWVAADKGPGSRKQGWQHLRQRLTAAAAPAPREEPGIFVCARCADFLRTVPVLPRDDRDPDDVDTEAEDHVADEVRYRLRGRGPGRVEAGFWR
jgi:hypothetical protein